MKRCCMCGLERELNLIGLCKRCEDIERLMEDILDKDASHGNPDIPYNKNVHQFTFGSKKSEMPGINNRKSTIKSPMAAILSGRLFPALAHYLVKEEKVV